jgi:hypothetical protein
MQDHALDGPFWSSAMHESPSNFFFVPPIKLSNWSFIRYKEYDDGSTPDPVRAVGRFDISTWSIV